MNSNAFLQLPPGSTGLFLEEAARHQEAIDATGALYRNWGYTMVHTPMVDFFDAHSHMFTDEEEERIYRLIGRDGEVLMLRSDITVFLLKHYQSLLKGAEYPVRLAYSDSILRHEASIDISRNDHYQTGAELISGNTADGDGEILLLLGENLEVLEIESPAIHLGSRKLLETVMAAAGISAQDRQKMAEIRTAIHNRDWQKLEELSPDYAALHGFFRYIGDSAAAAVATLPEALSGSEVRDEAAYLDSLAGLLRRQFPGMKVRIDMSEIGQRTYYSGLVFSVYVKDLPYAIASGGRYDSLIRSMGLDSGAVGYSLMLGALGKLPARRRAPEIIRLSETENTRSLEDRYRNARDMRKRGDIVCL
jgi:ATP phosphoribosyltransferase regulatory subunit